MLPVNDRKQPPLSPLRIAARRSLLPLASATCGLLLFAGCNSKPSPESHITGYSQQQLLGEFAELYRCAQLNLLNNHAPARISDLEKCKAGFPYGYQAAVKGDIIVVWGTPLGSGTNVLAYERDAASRGGWVVLQDGSVKQLTSSEFRATPKASK
ncbi:MAG: hypothetical protein ACJ8C4_20305 [Gemmataceae bacterium]